MYARFFVLLMLPGLLWCAGDSAIDRATLRGLKTLGVVIDPVEPALEKDGLSAANFRAQIEDELENAGIKVDRNATEFLGLRIFSVRAKGTPVAVGLALALYQPVTLVRDTSVRTATGTWEIDTVLLSPVKMLRSSSTESVKELVQQFIRAFQSANHK